MQPDNTMTKAQKQIILDRIAGLDKQNISIVESDSMLCDTLINTMPQDIKDAYNKMISNKIPF